MFNLILVILKFVVLATLYLFLAYVLVTLSRDVVRAGCREAPAAASLVAELVAVKGPGIRPGEEFPLGQTTVIGRAEDADVPLGDEFASERHAKITRTSSGYVLADLGSTNGTYVDDSRLSEAVLLSDGDEFTVGRTTLRFEAG